MFKDNGCLKNMFSSNNLFFKQYSSLQEIEDTLREYNCIKYAAYRSAAKLRFIQKVLYMDKVRLKVIISVFERHQLLQTENCVQLDKKEIQSILSDIYFVAQRENCLDFNLEFISELMASFLLSIYCKKKQSDIQVLSIKVGLTLLCEAKPREKYQYLFSQLGDHNNCMSKKKLEILLRKMISVTEGIGEELSFGFELISGTVESCFQHNMGSLGISEDDFIKWLMQDPQLLVWVSTMYRMQISESVVHNVKCSICKTEPIVGLRYRCLRCLTCDICQLCFFMGRVNKKHKLKHPVQEYCCPMTSNQLTKAFLLTLKNRLCKENSRLQYLPALKVGTNKSETCDQNTRLLDEMEIFSRTLISGSRVSLHKFPQKELQSIILHLERESEKLIPEIENFFMNVDNFDFVNCETELKTCLVKHRAQIKTQVQRLRLLKNYLTSTEKVGVEGLLASTPLVDGFLSKPEKGLLKNSIENFSPICRNDAGRNRTKSSRKMMWDNYDLVVNMKPSDVNASWEELSGSNSLKMSINEQKTNDGLFGLSSWLNKSLRELESSSKAGFTWLKEKDEKNVDARIVQETEETFEDIQNDLKQIINKIHELSLTNFKRDSCETNEVDTKEEKIQMVEEVDSILKDLINGIDKLIRS